MRNSLILYILLACLPMAARGQTITSLDDIDLSGLPQPTTAKALRYWFDNDASSLTTVSSVGGTHAIDANALLDGLHNIHMQLINSDDEVCYITSGLFLKAGSSQAGAVSAKKLMYWFDDEDDIKVVDATNGIQMLDASTLIDGLHTLHYQVLCNNGDMTATMSALFMRLSNDASAMTAKSLRYWFDEDASSVQEVDDFSGIQIIDVSGLIMGLHTIHCQLVDASGHLSAPVTKLFLKEYDVVIEGGQNRITRYRYWQNDNMQTMTDVTIDNADNPFQLITLLPMQKEPLLSQLFHFELANGVPMVYAKNMFHVRFQDARGYFVDSEKPFIDYSVMQEVLPVGELQSTQTFAKVTENDIRWYTIPLLPGDTVAFRMSQPATVQLFAPSGVEVFKTSEAASTQWSGTHVWEDGTYYLAIHDVTGSQSSMTLDYLHMDKYDVVDWDVHTVGNGGCSTITFKGNGFRDLYAVDLFNADGDSIHSVYIGHESDATTSVVFDFTGAELGVYHAVFHFAEEDKVLENLITVEEAKEFELALDVSYPTTFLRGTSVTYTIKITNKGNMTAYAVPLNLRLRVPSVNDISKVLFGGNLETISIPTDISSCDSIDEDVLTILYEEFENANDLSQFVFYRDSVENMDFGLSQVILDILPNSTETFTVTIYPHANSSSLIYLDAAVGKEWLPLTLAKDDTVKRALVKRKISREELCCNRTKIECVADVVANIAGVFMPPGANCATSLVLTGLETAFDVWCSDGNTAAEKFENYLQSQGKSLASKLVQSAVSCVTFFFNNRLKALRDDRVMAAKLGSTSEVERITQEMNGVRQLMRNTIKSIYQGVMSMVVGKECLDAFTKPIPNCPPGPPGGGPSSPVDSFDPNDIFGYLSEAGTHFIADSVTCVNYTIEFENDTAFATAAAHTIVVKDTLDGRYFDLKKFMPTNVRIGSKEVYLAETDIYSSEGVTSFVKTIDMRPEIYAIAQVEGLFSQTTGIAEWRFTSLDPMTMEPTDDLMQGILPVNYDGTSGMGEVMFDIGVKSSKVDGTEIKNRAGIVFDANDPIITPTWTNTVDAMAPTSTILGAIQSKTDTLSLRIAGEDNRSGVWRYDVYAQIGQGSSWEKVAENVPAILAEGETETLVDVRIFEGIEYGFMVLATDSAGNMERKAFEAEFELSTVKLGDANGDGVVDALDVVLAISYYLGEDVYLNFAAADVVADGEINALDVVAMQDIYLNTSHQALAPRKRKVKSQQLEQRLQ